MDAVFDVDPMAVLTREVLRERAAALIAESCAWAVGMSDRPHLRRRSGRVSATGDTLGARAAARLPLSGDEDGRLDLGDARPGSFQDALNALAPDGSLYAERFDDEVLAPFVLDTCVLAAERVRAIRPAAWAELVDDVGEDPAADPAAVVRAGDWEAPLRTDAEHLVLAALGHVPLVQVEAEGVPLALVRAAEAVAREAAGPVGTPPDDDVPADDRGLAGVRFLAETALRATGLPTPVPAGSARALLGALLAEGLEPEEIALVLPHLPVTAAAGEEIAALLADAAAEG